MSNDAQLEQDVPSTDETSETEVAEPVAEENEVVADAVEATDEVDVVVDRSMGIAPGEWMSSATPAYVEMVVRKREERGDLSAKQLKEYKTMLLDKHGLPKTVAQRKSYDRVQAERKAARKALRKAAAKEAREARKLELAAQSAEIAEGDES